MANVNQATALPVQAHNVLSARSMAARKSNMGSRKRALYRTASVRAESYGGPTPKAHQFSPPLFFCFPARLCADVVHFRIREAEMMADFVQQYLADQIRQVTALLFPVFQYRTPVQVDMI